MLEYFATKVFVGLLFLAIALAVAIPTAVYVLAWLDRRMASSRSRFAVHFARLQSDPRALAEYLGRRFQGVCLLIGIILAAFLVLR